MLLSEPTINKTKRMSKGDFEAITDQMLSEMKQLEEQMDKDHAEGERLNAETQIIKAHLATTLSQLEEQINRLCGAT